MKLRIAGKNFQPIVEKILALVAERNTGQVAEIEVKGE